jgi:putative heme-binding domain-containing protein
LLVALQAPDVVGKTLALLDAAGTKEEQIGYIYDLRFLKSGWTIDRRKHYLEWFVRGASALPSAGLSKWFADAGRAYSDGSSLPGYLEKFRQEAIGSLTETEAAELRPWLATNSPVKSEGPAPERRQFVRNWTVAELLPVLEKNSNVQGSAINGEKIFLAAGCAQCHRFAGEGGVVGPDLTAISKSNSRRDILESILEPSKVIPDQYRNTTLMTKDGDEYVGRVVADSAEEVEIMTDFVNRTAVKVRKADIQRREVSKISPMPQGLLNSYTSEEIGDLLVYLEFGRL